MSTKGAQTSQPRASEARAPPWVLCGKKDKALIGKSRRRAFIGSELGCARNEGETERFGLRLETLEAALSVFGFELGEVRLVVRGGGRYQFVDDAREEVGHGGERLGRAKARAQPAV